MAGRVGRVAGKVAQATAARGGIGRATAVALAAEGARLVLGDIADLGETAEAVRAAGAEAVVTVRLDVTSAADADAARRPRRSGARAARHPGEQRRRWEAGAARRGHRRAVGLDHGH